MAAVGLHSFQITLTNADANYNLYTLISAIDAAAPKRTKELVIQSDDANTGKVVIGDTNTSGTRYGYKLAPGDSRTYIFRFGAGVSTEDIYLRGITVAAAKVNVELVDF